MGAKNKNTRYVCMQLPSPGGKPWQFKIQSSKINLFPSPKTVIEASGKSSIVVINKTGKIEDTQIMTLKTGRNFSEIWSHLLRTSSLLPFVIPILNSTLMPFQMLFKETVLWSKCRSRYWKCKLKLVKYLLLSTKLLFLRHILFCSEIY